MYGRIGILERLYRTMSSLVLHHHRYLIFPVCKTIGLVSLVLTSMGFATMFGSLLPLLLSSTAIAGALPSRSASTHASFHAFAERGIFGPISTSPATGLAGGQIACDSPPVSSFFAGLKPPVCKSRVPFAARDVG